MTTQHRFASHLVHARSGGACDAAKSEARATRRVRQRGVRDEEVEEEHVGSPIFRCRCGELADSALFSPPCSQLRPAPPCGELLVKDMLAARLPRARGCSLLALGALVALLIGFMRVVWRLAHLETRHRWAPVPPAPDMAGGPAIPKVIHQMYQSEQLPAQWRNGSAAWKQLHPDYRYVLWTDASLRELIAAEYPQMLALYDGYPHATQRWDASRYAILHHHGGLYADLDLRPVRRVDGLLRGQHALLPHTPNIGLTNALMASTPRHPFFGELLRQLPAYARAPFGLSKHSKVLMSTGSTYVWAVFLRWAEARSRPPPVRVLPHAGPSRAATPRHGAQDASHDVPNLITAEDWGKCSVCVTPAVGGVSRSAFAHGPGSSWHSWDSAVVLWAFCNLELLVAVAAAAAVRLVLGRPLRQAIVAGGSVVVVGVVHRVLALNLLETFIARPLIWLIMT